MNKIKNSIYPITLFTALTLAHCGGTPTAVVTGTGTNGRTTPTETTGGNCDPRYYVCDPTTNTGTNSGTPDPESSSVSGNAEPAMSADFEFARGFPSQEVEVEGMNNVLVIRARALNDISEVFNYGQPNAQSRVGQFNSPACFTITFEVIPEGASSGNTYTTATIAKPLNQTQYGINQWARQAYCGSNATYADVNAARSIGGSRKVKIRVVNVRSTYVCESTGSYCPLTEAQKSSADSRGNVNYHVYRGSFEVKVNGTTFSQISE